MAACDPGDNNAECDCATGEAADADADAKKKISPHWVLKDKDGEAVRALVRPTCGYWLSDAADNCAQPDFGAVADFPCVHVFWHEDTFVNLTYDLATGEIGGNCRLGSGPGTDDWLSPRFRYESPNCDSPPLERLLFMHVLESGGVAEDPTESYAKNNTPARDPGVFSGGALYYATRDGGPIVADKFFTWDDIEEECVGGHSSAGKPHYPFAPVPDEIVNLLPNPPYTVVVEY